ncbi:MAG: hypothetical protein R2726_00635 [Acidimicrobiales bacterium]
MSDDGPASTPRDDSWLLQPPAPDEVQFKLSVPQGTELSPTAREALETLLSELQSVEVEAFASSVDCGDFFRHCKPYSCTLKSCQPLVAQPCFIDTVCRIAG